MHCGLFCAHFFKESGSLGKFFFIDIQRDRKENGRRNEFRDRIGEPNARRLRVFREEVRRRNDDKLAREGDQKRGKSAPQGLHHRRDRDADRRENEAYTDDAHRIRSDADELVAVPEHHHQIVRNGLEDENAERHKRDRERHHKAEGLRKARARTRTVIVTQNR